MEEEKTETYDGSILGAERSLRVKQFVVMHPEAGFKTIRDLVRKAVDDKLQAIGAD